MHPAKRVILNTGFLYAKMAISIFVALFSTRLILTALGVNDFGIFSLVGGVIAMLSFLNAAMSVATQRYLSYFIGAGDSNKLSSVFRNSVILHLAIGFVIIAILEIAGVFLFNGFLNIPVERIETAKLIFQFMIVSTFFTINAVPYDAIINSHENMLFDALSGIFESFMKLGIAILLIYSNFDKLVVYGLLMAGLTILIRIIKSYYCTKKYSECKIKIRGVIDRSLLTEMFLYAGWNMFGALCSLGKTQGIAIVLNLFLGTVVNAAYGIANQVAAQLNFFSQMMLRALNPQIMKSEGANNRERMIRLSMMASKFSFFLLAFIALPCIFEMPAILKFWLKDVPEYTVAFCSLILVSIMINQMTVGLDSAIHATGNIKLYMLIAGTIKLMIVPCAFVLLKLGQPAISVVIGYAAFEALAGIARIFILKKIIGLQVKLYLKYVFAGMFIPISVTVLYLYLITNYFTFNYRFVFTIFSGAFIFLSSVFVGGLSGDEKKTIKMIIGDKLGKLLNLRTYVFNN